jgi:hypothetical protein
VQAGVVMLRDELVVLAVAATALNHDNEERNWWNAGAKEAARRKRQ